MLINMEKGGCVYIITNKHHTTLYTGVTSDLQGRLWQHKNKTHPNSFTARYNLDKLVYYVAFSTIDEAIKMEKIIKGKSRAKKEKMIEEMNTVWNDLGEAVLKW